MVNDCWLKQIKILTSKKLIKMGNTIMDFGLITLMLFYSKTLKFTCNREIGDSRTFSSRLPGGKKPENMLFSSVCFHNEFFLPWTVFPTLFWSFPMRNHSMVRRKPG